MSGEARGIFNHPRLAHLRSVLERSQLGERIVAANDGLPTMVTIIDAPQVGLSYVQDQFVRRQKWMLYHNTINRLVLPESHLHPEGLATKGFPQIFGISEEQAAVTVGHEAFHRLQRAEEGFWSRTLFRQPLQAPGIAWHAAMTPDPTGRGLVERVNHVLTKHALQNEIDANHVEGVLARDLGVSNRFVNTATGEVLGSEAILDVMQTPYYRRLATQSKLLWGAEGVLGAGVAALSAYAGYRLLTSRGKS